MGDEVLPKLQNELMNCTEKLAYPIVVLELIEVIFDVCRGKTVDDFINRYGTDCFQNYLYSQNEKVKKKFEHFADKYFET